MSPVEPSPPLRVLLVEDYLDLAEVTAELLTAEGLDVRIALSGREALAVAPVFLPHILLCDLNLPDMTGLDVIRGVRANSSTEETYVVILTAMQEMGLTDARGTEAEQPRVDAFLTKPITLEAIRTLLEKLTTFHDR